MRLLANDRRVDLIGEGIDVAIRVRDKLDTDTSLILRNVGLSRIVLCASKDFLDARGRPAAPADLESLPLLSWYEHEGAQTLELIAADGQRLNVELQARLICGEFNVLYEAAKRGMGVAALPEFVCAPAIARGELEVLLPQWSIPQGIAHFVYASRRGLLPGVRAFVDFLAERLPDALRVKHEQCKRRNDQAA